MKVKKLKTSFLFFPSTKKKILFWRSLGFIFLLILIARIKWQDTLQILKIINYRFFVLAVFLEPMRLLIEALRWKLLLLFQGCKYRLKDAFWIILASCYLGHITPGRLGNLIRGFYLSNDTNLSLGFSFSSVILEKYLELSLTFLFGIVAAFFYLGGVNLLYIPILAVFMLVFFYFLIYSHNFQNILARTFFFRLVKNVNLKQGLKNFQEGLKFLKMRAIILGYLITFLAFLIYFFHGYMVACSLDVKIKFLDMILILALTKMISRIIPFSFSGWGCKDISLILIFKNLGIDMKLAFAFTLIFLFSSYFVSLILGFFAWEKKLLLWKKS